MLAKPKVAIVHNWLTDRGGSENVLFELCKIFPEAPVYTLVYKSTAFPELENTRVITTWLQKVPWFRWRHEFFPPLRYFIWRFKKISGYDLVITNSSSENKAVRTPGAFHLAYIHTPPHYYWRYFNDYLKNPGFGKADFLARFFLRMLNPILKNLDYKSAQNPDALLANSKFIQDQISQYYGRDSTVLYPFIDTTRFKFKDSRKKDYYLVFGRQTPFKKTELTVEAFNNQASQQLIVAGDGPELPKLKAMAGKNITLTGRVETQKLVELIASAKACIFANEEDFGITWLESMALGTPVICFGSGGALETVAEGKTGLFFKKQTSSAIVESVKKFEKMSWDRKAIANHANQFSPEVFRRNLLTILKGLDQPGL